MFTATGIVWSCTFTATCFNAKSLCFRLFWRLPPLPPLPPHENRQGGLAPPAPRLLPPANRPRREIRPKPVDQLAARRHASTLAPHSECTGEPLMPTAVEDYLSLYERYWQRYTELLLPLPAAALNWRPPVTGAGVDPATNTAAAIAAHISGGQRYWIGQVIGGGPAQPHRPAHLALVGDD